ncbi:MAG: hypothetical protein LBU39_01940 [Desulfobulbaceae bacterium]|jgi:hypothetical protein|nr:hypothetical protein [Desulfobulbaceae bacterium]
MTVPMIYRWDDADAPILAGQTDSFCALLQSCLVDGYTNRDGAGWTVAYRNQAGGEISLRTAGANARYYAVAHNTSTNTQKSATVTLYETMSAVNVGINGTPVEYVYLSSTTSALGRPWMIIADAYGAYIFVANSATTLTSQQFWDFFGYFGEGIPALAGDNYFQVLGLGLSASVGSQCGMIGGVNAPSASSRMDVLRNGLGVVGAAMCQCLGAGQPSPVSGAAGLVGSPYPWNGNQTIIGRLAVSDDTAYSFRGWLPGLYYPCHNSPFENFTQIEEGGKTLMAQKVKISTSNGQVLIDISAGFRP